MDLLGISRVLPINRIVGSNIAALEIPLEIVVVCSLQDGCVSKLGNQPPHFFTKGLIFRRNKAMDFRSKQPVRRLKRWQVWYPRAVMYMRLTVASKTSSNEALNTWRCWAAERVDRFASRELPIDSRWEVGSLFKIGKKIQQKGFLIVMNHFFQGVVFWGSLFEMFLNLQHCPLARSGLKCRRSRSKITLVSASPFSIILPQRIYGSSQNLLPA